MCGRFSLTVGMDKLVERFAVQPEGLSARRRYNIAPGQPVLVIPSGSERRTEAIRWGMIQPWAKEDTARERMINLRSESVVHKPIFKGILQTRRCLVPADGFYEWKSERGEKIPWRFVLKSGEPFAFAGLWDDWTSPSGQTVRSCAIITTAANELVGSVHTRMPVILAPESESLWLDATIQEPNLLADLLQPYPSELMESYEVSPVVNSPANDVPECIEPPAEEDESENDVPEVDESP
jgi:putative SOS response-associated peptidase YedK